MEHNYEVRLYKHNIGGKQYMGEASVSRSYFNAGMSYLNNPNLSSLSFAFLRLRARITRNKSTKTCDSDKVTLPTKLPFESSPASFLIYDSAFLNSLPFQQSVSYTYLHYLVNHHQDGRPGFRAT